MKFVIIGVLAFLALCFWCCLKTASDSDNTIDDMFEGS